MHRGIGFQPVREMIFWQWLAVPVGCWLTGCCAGWCAGISKVGPSARRLKAYATDGGPCSPSPRPSPAVTRVLLLGSRLVGEGARAAFAAGVGNGSPSVARLVDAGSPRCPAQRASRSASREDTVGHPMSGSPACLAASRFADRSCGPFPVLCRGVELAHNSAWPWLRNPCRTFACYTQSHPMPSPCIPR
jgi:hypothetical protein